MIAAANAADAALVDSFWPGDEKESIDGLSLTKFAAVCIYNLGTRCGDTGESILARLQRDAPGLLAHDVLARCRVGGNQLCQDIFAGDISLLPAEPYQTLPVLALFEAGEAGDTLAERAASYILERRCVGFTGGSDSGTNRN